MKKKFIKYLQKLTFKDIFIILLVILVGMFYITNNITNRELTNIKNKFIGTDTIQQYKDKNGNSYDMIDTPIFMNKKDLKNTDFYKDIKGLYDNPLIITKTKQVFHIDTVYAHSDTIITTTINDTTYHELQWHVKEPNNWYSMNGNTKVEGNFNNFNTTITGLNIKNELTLDIIEKDKQLKVIAKNSNPYMSNTDMKSVVIEPQKSKVLKEYFKPGKFSVGPYIGVGIDKSLNVSPQIGIGLTYTIFRF